MQSSTQAPETMAAPEQQSPTPEVTTPDGATQLSPESMSGDGLQQAASLEAVELELALNLRDVSDDALDAAVQEALEAAGAVLLFQMRMAQDENTRWVAAVATGNADDTRISIVTLRNDGETLVEPVEQSNSPIAAIAPAYAGLAIRWSHAA
jgi:hypothetical protein